MTERPRALLLAALATCGCAASTGASDEVVTSSSESGSTESSSESSSTESSSESSSTETGGDPRPERLAVTADWRAKRLSLLDYAALRDGATTREDALWREIDLAAWEPGPMQLALTPDGTRALVTITPGFFTGVVGNLVGAGTVPEGHALVLIDLDDGTLVHEFEPSAAALHPVILADGVTAWTTNYGGGGTTGTTIARLDLDAGTIVEEFEAGALPHQLDFAADESLAIYALASDGAVHLFDPSDPAATLSAGLSTSGDTGWALLLDDGSTRAVAANSLEPSSYAVLDVADPSNPQLLETVELAGIPYAALAIGDGSRVLMTTIELAAETMHLLDIDLTTQPSTITRDLALPAGGFPLGLAYDESDELVLIPGPGDDVLVVVELASEQARAIPWQDATGPTYVVLEPPP